MSYDDNVYLGPLARCRFPTTEVEVVTERRCPQCAGGPGGSAEFCPTHGIPVVKTTRKEIRSAVNYVDLGLKIHALRTPWQEDGAWPKTEHVWMSNLMMQADHPRAFIIDEWSAFQPIAAETPAREIAWFETKFAKELALLREAYGADSVTLDWALVRWQS